jgi:GMP synthase (glutamine-hydrolysing)
MNLDQGGAYPPLAIEIEAIREALHLELPVLGICLGAQLLAAALGASVRANPVREIGWYRLDPAEDAHSDRVCRHLAARPHVFQWHAYTFDLPRGAVHLASTESCRNQAFRHGERAYGLQFHLEADEALIGRWLSVPAYQAEVDADRAGQILRDTQSHIRAALSLGERVFREFIELFAWRQKLRLASR